ncbi:MULTISPECIES: carbohydrate ABC transporter permease [unclassified Micromonospora]|uniref:carbohydrate ABC transporter permease n=1 Tax=unclassified Micromonospora TaxID=2617518 RepID=UPI00104C33F5|nr:MULTISPECIES: carbohydrate ABC transporter permease [unclassified Micromonospora]TDB80768.1 carbohydrate ABC transporter permease [Micromonospora sp. KC721]TDC35996.1 carbohydrate ABC transporter permease [Micromonospora sp. KC213]
MAVTTSTPRPSALRRKRPNAPGELSKRFWATSVMWLLVVAYGFPVLWFLLSSFKPAGELFSYPLTFFPDQPTIKGYTQAWTSFDVATYFVNTLIVAVSATVLTIVASAACGYALAKYNNWWVRAFTVCVLATTMLPGEVILAPLFLVVRDMGLYNSLAAVVVPAVITATGTFMFRQFFLTVPNDLLEAARIDGAGELSTFVRIMLPLSRPIMLTLAIFSFQWRWNDYIWPLVVLNDPNKFTLQIGVASIVGAQNVNWSVLLGASVLSMVPLVAIYLLFQKYVMDADINAGLKD